MVGETTRMSCNYQGKPIPDIRWLRQGKVIETDDIKYIVSVDNSSEKEVTSYLEIIGYVIWITLVTILSYFLKMNVNYPVLDEQYLSISYDSRLSHADNGTYLCHGENQYHADVAVMDTVVYDKPEVSIDLVKAVDSDKIYLNWTIVRWNSPVTDYYLSYRTNSQDSWEYFTLEKISPEADAFVMRNLTANTPYFIKLSAENK